MLEKTGRFFFDKDNRFVLDEKGFSLGMRVPVLVLTRSDGTSLYPLRDIAYALATQKKGENIVVLGEDQKLYNEQINAALLILEKKPRKAVYYSFVLLVRRQDVHKKRQYSAPRGIYGRGLEKSTGRIEEAHKRVDIKLRR